MPLRSDGTVCSLMWRRTVATGSNEVEAASVMIEPRVSASGTVAANKGDDRPDVIATLKEGGVKLHNGLQGER